MNTLKPASIAATILLALLCGCKSGREKALQVRPEMPTPYVLKFPLGLQSESAVIPADNPLTLEKVRLGKRLFSSRTGADW